MSALPWLVAGPRSERLFVVGPDAPSATRADAVAGLDFALTGFAAAPPAWFLAAERLGRWWLAVWTAVAVIVMPFALGDAVGGVAAGAFIGLVGGAAVNGLAVYAVKAAARRGAGRTAEETVAALASSVRPAPGGLEWAEAVIASDPAAEHEVHALVWRMTDYGTEAGADAADALFKRWKRIAPEAAAAIEAEEAAELEELEREERGA